MNLKKLGIGITIAGTLAGGGTFAADRAVDPYTDKGTHYELPIVSDIPQGERVEISKDRAEITLKGWNDEYAIKIIPQIPTSSLGATDRDFKVSADRPLFSKRMEYKNGDVTAFIEPREGKGNEFDIDFTLNSKPETNVFEYKIEGAEDFDFLYQPELSPEEVIEGVERSENVIGSYAVYHKIKANYEVGSTNYATGKSFHIYRPKAVDANNNEIWAELSYNYVDTLSVTVPQKFLDEAKYPIKIDPTFGYTTLGASADITGRIASQIFSGPKSSRIGIGVALSSAGTLSKISVGIKADGSGTLDVTAFVNTEDTATDSHTQVSKIERLGVSVTTTSTFFDFTAASEVLSATNYVLNAIGDGADLSLNNAYMLYDSSGTQNNYEENFDGAYTTGRDEFPWTETDTSGSLKFSIYATYTAAATGPASIPRIIINAPTILRGILITQ